MVTISRAMSRNFSAGTLVTGASHYSLFIKLMSCILHTQMAAYVYDGHFPGKRNKA